MSFADAAFVAPPAATDAVPPPSLVLRADVLTTARHLATPCDVLPHLVRPRTEPPERSLADALDAPFDGGGGSGRGRARTCAKKAASGVERAHRHASLVDGRCGMRRRAV